MQIATTMKSVILLISLFIYGIEGQDCNETAQQTQFVLALDNGVACGINFQTTTLDPSSLAGMQALDQICTAGCAGAVSNWLVSTECNNTAEGLGLRLWCIPADDAEIPRCRYALDEVDPTLFNNTILTEECTTFDWTSCPGNCATALNRIRNEIGCCYQSIYNNTEVLSGLANEIPQEAVPLFTLLGNPLLWGLCQVEIPEACMGEPFPVNAIMTVTDSPTSTTSGAHKIYQDFMLATMFSIILGVLTSVF